MKVGDKILDLHGITYEIREIWDFHIHYPHPLIQGVMTKDTLTNTSINIHAASNAENGDFIGVCYNTSLRLYVNILLKMLDYSPEKDIRNGYKNLSTVRTYVPNVKVPSGSNARKSRNKK